MKRQLSKTLIYPTLVFLSILTNSSNAKEAVVAETSAVNIDAQLAYPLMLKSQTKNNYLKVALTGSPMLDKAVRSPINISLVIDRSGSMSGDKIAKARDAALLAVDMLGKDDMISVIGYDFSAEVIVPATKLSDKSRVKNQIRDAIRAKGNTALFAGVSKGIAEVNKFLSKNNVNRVILLSDGQANVGPSSSSELGELGISAAKQGIAVSTIGLGVGYNEDLMTTLAGYSDGNHFFVEKAADLEVAFNREFNDVMDVVAQDVNVVIDVKHGKPVRLWGRDGKIRGNKVTVKLNQIYAKQEKYVLLEIASPNNGHQGEKTVADVDVSYRLRGLESKQKHQQAVKVLYTDSQELAEKAANEDVLADVFVQQSNLANTRAIEQLDKGDKQGSVTTLYGSAIMSYEYKDTLKSPEAKAKVQQQINKLEAAEKAIQAAPPSKARKIMKMNSYSTSNQQKN